MQLRHLEITLQFAFLIAGAQGVKIVALRVPSEVRNGSGHAAILDCDYSLKLEEYSVDAGLVVKWFFNNSPAPVYQWIIGKKPQDLGILKGKLNLRHRVSDNSHTMHRALYINNPTTELSGEYKCFVSTFNDEDFMTKKMVVYVPEERFWMRSVAAVDKRLLVTCSAEGVFPEPELLLYTDFEFLGEESNIGMRTTEWTSIEKSTRRGVYDVIARASLPASMLRKSTDLICKLRIPSTKYHVVTSQLFRPDTAAGSQLLNAKQQLIVVSLLSLTLINTIRLKVAS